MDNQYITVGLSSPLSKSSFIYLFLVFLRSGSRTSSMRGLGRRRISGGPRGGGPRSGAAETASDGRHGGHGHILSQ